MSVHGETFEANKNSSPATGEPPVVAVFDFDGTLTRHDSLLPFLWYLAGPLRFLWNAVLLSPVLLGYALGWVANGPAKERVFSRFVGGRPANEVREAAEQFAAEYLPSILDPEAMERLRWHQRRGHTTVLVSASVELYVCPWAEEAGFDAVMGTRLKTKGSVFTGQFEGNNCYGSEKVSRLKSFRSDLERATVIAYGNSKGDHELLSFADQGLYQTFESSSTVDSAETTEESNTSGLPSTWQRGLLLSVVGASILYLGLVLWSGADEIFRGLQALSPFTVAGLLLLVSAGYLIRFGRWHWYLQKLGAPVPWRPNLRAFLASFALTATPGKAGESIKAYLLKHSHNVPPTDSMGGLFAERFTDLFSVVLVVCGGLFVFPQGRWIVIGVGLVQGGLIVALQYPQHLRRRLLLPMAQWAVLRRWVRVADEMLDSTSALLHPRPLLVGLLLGGLPWIAEGIGMYVLFQAIGAEAIALHEAVFIHAAATLFGAVTFLPGGLGGHEAASVSLSLLYGASQPHAVVVTVIVRLLTLWFAVAIGVVAMVIEIK